MQHLSLLGGADDIDSIMARIIDEYDASPPDDAEMARLSILLQQTTDSGGGDEYATLTMWLCAVQSILNSELKRAEVERMFSWFAARRAMVATPHLRRSWSWPLRGRATEG